MNDQPFPNWIFFLGGQAWEKAIDEFDRGNVGWIADYVASTEPLCQQHRTVIASILRKERKSDGRGHAKKKRISQFDKIEAAQGLEYLRARLHELLSDKELIESIADESGLEPIEVIAKIRVDYNLAVEKLAASFDMATTTIRENSKQSRNKK